MRVYLSLKSSNSKTGPIPVSTTSDETCPPACPLRDIGCYAKAGPLWFRWLEVTRGERGGTWQEFVDKVAALPAGQLWRHNQAGDLPGEGDTINDAALGELVKANRDKRGFTYTHKPMNEHNAFVVSLANYNGFTINLSANNLEHADTLAALAVAPVVTVLPADVQGNQKVFTPAGRQVAVCPATYDERVTCSSCQLCQRQNRKVIVGFPAHGAQRKSADKVARGE